MKRFLFLIVLIVLMEVPSIARALDWYVAFDLSIPDASTPRGALQSRLVLGVDPAATDAFNNEWDTVALWSSPLKATFHHPENANSGNPDAEWLWQDIRANNQPTHTWNIEVSSDRLGTNTTIFWSLNTTNMQCQRLTLTLNDQTHGSSIPLSGSGSYTFPNGADPTQLAVDFSQGAAALPPSAPTNLWSPRQAKDSILLSWSSLNEPDLLGFHLFRRASGQTAYTQVTSQPLTSPSFMDRNLSPGETYFYKVTAVNTDGCASGESNEVSVVLN